MSQDIEMSATDILNHMKNGAKLHRGFGDHIELRLNSGIVMVPATIFDQLLDEQKIADDGPGGFYRPT